METITTNTIAPIDQNKIAITNTTMPSMSFVNTGDFDQYAWSQTFYPSITTSAVSKTYEKKNFKLKFRNGGELREIPVVKSIKKIGKKTFVYWQDGTFTKVTCERDQQPDAFAAYCIAFTKKIYGSTSAILKEIEDHDEAILRQKKKEENRKIHEENRKKEREAFNKEVEKKRHELAVLRAAEKKLNGEA